MKTTIDIPDDLYRRIKARSAMLGLAVREVTIDLYTRWLGEEEPTASPAEAERWVDEWRDLGRTHLSQRADRDETTRDIVESDRGRLDGS